MSLLSSLGRAPLQTLLLCAAFIGLTAPAEAQTCPGPGQTFWKGDTLPDDPTGSLPINIITNLCPGQAIAEVFELGSTGHQRLVQVACPFAANGGVSGLVAGVNVQIFDGVTFSGSQNTPLLGPKIFDYVDVTGNVVPVTSKGLNTIDLSGFDIIVGQGGASNFVVAFTMEVNPNGDCGNGYTANFFADNTQFLFSCDPVITPAKTSLIFIEGQGWSDVTTTFVNEIPICPFFFSGVWVIRACTEAAEQPNSLHITATSNPVPIGGFTTLTFHAPGFEGEAYLAAASLGTSPGASTPYGVVPLNFDILTELSLSNPANFVNFTGAISPTTSAAQGLFVAPNNSAFVGFSFYLAFIVVPETGPWGISDALRITLQ